jgi:hypothetical protein
MSAVLPAKLLVAGGAGPTRASFVNKQTNNVTC